MAEDISADHTKVIRGYKEEVIKAMKAHLMSCDKAKQIYKESGSLEPEKEAVDAESEPGDADEADIPELDELKLES